ncbi:MAG: maleylpyruvate isomerase [Cryptosporangiaceae bacterium]|nr:maleylpyruvate isomerase [Cryptosporangiaceae bacterium]
MTYDYAAALAAIPGAHDSLRRTLSTLTEDEARGPSALPGWTRGHVATHIARNAEAVVRLLAGAIRDEFAEQYPGGAQGRNGAIEEGAGRSPAELAADIDETSAEAEAALAEMTPEAWTRTVVFSGGRLSPASRIAWARWREVELHPADHALDRYTPAHWPTEFVAAHLAHELDKLPSRLPEGLAVTINGRPFGSTAGPASVAIDGPGHAVLAWLTGRPTLTAGLTTTTGPLPDLPPWA